MTQHYELIRFHVILNWIKFLAIIMSHCFQVPIFPQNASIIFYLCIYLEFKMDIGDVLFARPFDNKINVSVFFFFFGETA